MNMFSFQPAMIIPVDIHTHRLPQMPGEAIVNCYPEEFAPQAGGWYSVGIHPWRIGTSLGGNRQADVSVVRRAAKNLLSRELAAHPQVLAIGEAGLDKLAEASLEVQMEIFEYQARLAEEVGKPLVIHLVKAVDELLRLKQAVRPSVPWIIHGFRGKAVLAEEYFRHGFYLSFGEKYQEEALRRVPVHRLFMETDESPVTVAGLYERAAGVRGVSVEELRKAVQVNIRKVFFER